MVDFDKNHFLFSVCNTTNNYTHELTSFFKKFQGIILPLAGYCNLLRFINTDVQKSFPLIKNRVLLCKERKIEFNFFQINHSFVY